MSDEYWDNETLRAIADEYGQPEPSDGQCNGLRQMIADKIKQCIDQGLNNVGIATDGKSVFVHKNNRESLVFAMRKIKQPVTKIKPELKKKVPFNAISRQLGIQHAICVRGKIVRVDATTALRWEMRKCDMQIARTELPTGFVSTVFINRFVVFEELGNFETMYFPTHGESGQWRWTTYEEALEGHKAVVEQIKQGPKFLGRPVNHRKLKKWQQRLVKFLSLSQKRGAQWCWDNRATVERMAQRYDRLPITPPIALRLAAMYLEMVRNELSAASATPLPHLKLKHHST